MFSGAHTERVYLAVNKDSKKIKGCCWIHYPGGAMDIVDCVIDTGASRSVIPQHLWEPFIEKADADKLTLSSIRGISGRIPARSTELRLGLSGVSCVGDAPFDLGMCDVYLAMDEDAAKEDVNKLPMKFMLLGMGGRALDKGGLCINWKEGHACFIEVGGPSAGQ